MPSSRWRLGWREFVVGVLLASWVGCSTFSDAVKLKQVSLDLQSFTSTPRLLELPGRQATQSLGLNLNVGLPGPFYWNNRVHSLISGAHFEWVGWQFEVGASTFAVWDLPFGMDIFLSHHSQHALDHIHPFVNFPVEDTIGVRFYLFRGK